jgi:hypothetical protein
MNNDVYRERRYGAHDADPTGTRPYWVTFTLEGHTQPIECILYARHIRDAERRALDLIPGAASITVERPS